jgi:hypothetical protein
MNKKTGMRRFVVWLGVPAGMVLGMAAPGWAAIGVIAVALLIVQVLRVRCALVGRIER